MATITVTNLTGSPVAISELHDTIPASGSIHFDAPDWRLLAMPTLLAAKVAGTVSISIARTSDETASGYDTMSNTTSTPDNLVVGGAAVADAARLTVTANTTGTADLIDLNKGASQVGKVDVNGNATFAGAVKPTSAATGAKSLVNVLSQSYVIDFGAFAGGGASQSQAEVMTGVAFGDALSVGVDADVSAEMATVGAVVTSAGNIAIVITPLTAAGTVNPASHTYTVTAIRVA